MRRGPQKHYNQSEKARREDSYGKWGNRGSENRGISLEEDDWGSNEDEFDRTTVDGVKTKTGVVDGGKYGKGGHFKTYRNEEVVDLDVDEEITEDKTQNNKQSGPYGGGRQRYSGAKAGTSYANESKKSRKTSYTKKT